MKNILPILDKFQSGFSPSMNNILDRQGAAEFVQQTPEWYGSDYNVQLLMAWLEKEGVPTTSRNCSIAFLDLQKRGVMEEAPFEEEARPAMPADRGIKRIQGLKVNPRVLNMADAKLISEDPSRVEELCGDKIRTELGLRKAAETLNDKDLKTASQASRVRGKENRHAVPLSGDQYTHARALVGATHPALKRDSPEFNAKIVALLQGDSIELPSEG